jgi:hypothetical protein
MAAEMASPVYVAVWEGTPENHRTNMGSDYGGRLTAAWLDRQATHAPAEV